MHPLFLLQIVFHKLLRKRSETYRKIKFTIYLERYDIYYVLSWWFIFKIYLGIFIIQYWTTLQQKLWTTGFVAYRISSNKRRWYLFNSKVLRCGGAKRMEVLYFKVRGNFNIKFQKFVIFLFQVTINNYQ